MSSSYTEMYPTWLQKKLSLSDNQLRYGDSAVKWSASLYSECLTLHLHPNKAPSGSGHPFAHIPPVSLAKLHSSPLLLCAPCENLLLGIILIAYGVSKHSASQTPQKPSMFSGLVDPCQLHRWAEIRLASQISQYKDVSLPICQQPG